MPSLPTSIPPQRCSFCGKAQGSVSNLAAGADVFICNECVELCIDMLGVPATPLSAEGMGAPTSTAGPLTTRVSEGQPNRSQAPSRRLILASSSVSRLRLLRDAGFDPAVVVSGVDEGHGGLSPARAVVAIAERKALAVAARCPDGLVIGCDSMLDVDGQALGKPASGAEAREMWRRFSGRRATLHTGHCLIDTAHRHRVSRLASSVVHFGTPSDSELSAYVATRAPLALAGGFSLEGLSGPFIRMIEGSPSNVLGLSLPDFRDMLVQIGVQITDLWKSE